MDIGTNNIMLDLETMGTGPNSAIVAIGAVRIGSVRQEDEFYATVHLSSSVAAGMTLDADTVQWWLGQSEAARQQITGPGRQMLQSVLWQFSKWLGDTPAVWGNGADFDNVILASAYRLASQTQPWKFWHNRCYRTLRALVPEVEYIKPAIPHHALHDARAQARHLEAIIRHTNRGRITEEHMREAEPC